ncbi:unnamed protein product [Leptidea sinapis]|uniref:Endonuclease/exonuclease/phosphatase domain-containing protein n=1 Tax=Leptidea sinapis TaxID=189913 RepID=A0A5E4Q439_9NEOP|nr:unnamed protein product [Leptidea sinapis]
MKNENERNRFHQGNNNFTNIRTWFPDVNIAESLLITADMIGNQKQPTVKELSRGYPEIVRSFLIIILIHPYYPPSVTDNSETLIDIILTDTPSKCQKVDIIHNRDLSDHTMVWTYFNIKKPRFNKTFKFKRYLHNMDLTLFKSNLNH